MELAKLYVTIAADTKKLTAGLAMAKGEIAKTTAGMGASFQTMGIAMVAAGAVITAAFGLTIKSAMDFEAELAQVSTMLDSVSMKHMPEFKSGLQSLAMEFGESTSTLSKGLYDILSASIEPSKALDVLAVASKAATAGITDTGVAADAITTIINSYGLEAEDAGKVSDQLFAIVKRGKTTFAQLAPAIGTVAATANMAGLSFEDLGASIATITRAGINTNAAMTAINGVLKAFLKPQEKAVTAAKQFGLELNTTTLKTIGLTGVMEKLKDATAEELAAIFGSIRGLKGMAAALGDVEGYMVDYNLLLNSAGLSQEAFEKQSATLKFQLGKVKQSFVILFQTIGEKFIPVMKAVSAILIKATGSMKKFMDAHPKLTKAIVLVVSALGALALAGGMIALAIIAFGKLKIALIALKTAFIAVKTAILLFSGPVGWIIAGVIALAAAWIFNWGKIRDFTLAMVEPIKKALGFIIDKFIWVLEKLGLYKKEVESLGDGGGGAGAFGDEIKEVGDKATEAVDGVDELGEEIGELGDAAETAEDKLDEFGNKIETFDEWVKRLAEETATANKELADAAEEAYGRYEDAMSPIEDKLYALTHTEEEVAAKKLELERKKTEAIIAAAELGTEKEEEEMAKVKKVYQAGIDEIIKKIEEKKQAEIKGAKETEETAAVQERAIYGIETKWDELINKVGEYQSVLKKVAAEQFLASVPTIDESGYTPDYLPPEGEAEGFAKGTPYIKKSGWAKVHLGEAILPEKVNPFSGSTSSNVFNNQRTANESTYSPTVNVNVQGNGDPWSIKKATKEALDESAIQYSRRGSWVMPGG